MSPASAEGAFAVSPKQGGGFAFGISQNLPTKQEAASVAIQKCQIGGPYCQVKFNFAQACFALATQVVGPHYAVATRPSLGDAIQIALTGCVNHGAPCQIKLQFCDTVSEQAIVLQRQMEQQRQQQAAAATQAEFQRERQATQEAQQRRIAAEQAASAAEQRRIVAENAARAAEQERASSTRNSIFSGSGVLNEKVPINTITKALAAFILFVWLAHVKSKESIPPVVRGLIGVLVPTAQSLVFFFLGIREEVTLGEISLLSAPFGLGELVLALIYRPHVA
jgi:hypothetical protein